MDGGSQAQGRVGSDDSKGDVFTAGNTFSTAYFELTLMIIELFMIYFIRKLKTGKMNFVIYGLICALNMSIIS